MRLWWRKRHTAPNPAPIAGVEHLERTHGMMRWATIGGVRFMAIDEFTEGLTEYVDRIEALGQHDRARLVRHVRDHYVIAALDLDLEEDPS